MSEEEKLYELIAAIDVDNIEGFTVHESSFIDCQFPTESYGYRIYHKDGFCFDVTFERQFDEEGKEKEPCYDFITGVFDGFNDISIEQAIVVIEAEGVFV